MLLVPLFTCLCLSLGTVSSSDLVISVNLTPPDVADIQVPNDCPHKYCYSFIIAVSMQLPESSVTN